MTEQEARIIVLEDALRQAQNTVEFLHNCLVNPVDETIKTGCKGYSYGYPEHTVQELKEWKALCPRVKDIVGRPCFHSMNKEDCESCQMHHKHRVLLYEAKGVLGIPRGEYL